MRKYLLFIVEGKNDKKEIQTILRVANSSFLERYVDAYIVYNGDITVDYNEKNIIPELNKRLIRWRNGEGQPFQKISPADVKMIIHIVDTDGVFIPETAIFQNDEGKVIYKDKSINYQDRNLIIGRNRKKAKVINKLLETKQIDNIPYKIYFASCNMDHLLFNKRNPKINDKGRNALLFASKCKEIKDLQRSVFLNGVCANGSYEDSWHMIQQGYNSLARHTNINLMLKSIE